jgi:HEAT repeats/NACHT domain
MEWLVIWGVAKAAGLLAKPILEDFAKDTGKDFAKDFFKDGLKKVIHLPEPNILKEAYGKALKEFLQLMEQELVNANCREEQIREYIEPLKQFVRREDVAAALGTAFELNCKSLDTRILDRAWAEITSPSLPEDFDWELVSKLYIRAIKKIVTESEKLRSIHTAQAQIETASSIKDLVGIPPEFNLRTYAEGLQEQYGTVKLESLDTTGVYYSDLKLWKIFIPQNVRECQEFLPQVYELPKEHGRRLRDNGQVDEAEIAEAELERRHQAYRSQVNRSILEIVAGNSPVQKVVILGDPGAGKSSLLQYLALIWAELPIRDLAVPPTPLLVELRTYARDRQAGTCKDILTFLHGGNITCRLDQQQLHDKLKAGQAIALFDGIDEVFDPALRDEVVTDIHRFTNDYPQVRVIATSRWLGYKVQRLRDAGFQHFMLQDLEDEQIEDFIQKWHDLTFPIGADKERKRDRLQKALSESKSIRELAGNPLLLTMMAILNRHQELPRDRPELYNQASRVLLHQWDVERLLEDPQLKDWKISLDYKDKQGMLRKVAHHMQSSAKGLAGNIISATDLENILTEYLRGIIEKGEPRMVARQMIYQLRHRNFILCSLGADSYAFVHRTFLEYFCAWEFVWQFKETQTLTVEQLKNEVFAPHWQDESWHEVLRLISGMVDAKFVAEMIDYLLEQKIDQNNFLDWEYRLTKEGLSNLLLAVNCFAEVRNRQEIDSTYSRCMKALKCKIEPDYPNELHLEAAIAITSLIATICQGNTEILSWLKSCLNTYSGYSISESIVQTIAKWWKNEPDILPWIKHCAKNEDNLYVRDATIRVLIKEWKDDPDTLSILKYLLQNDNNSGVRSSIVTVLALKWKDNPDTLPMVKHLVQNDISGDVRRAAINALIKGWKDNPDTLPMVKYLMQNDISGDVRRAAINALIKGWKDDPETLPWLKDRAQHDDDGAVRRAAIQALAQSWKNAPQMFKFLGDRAVSDSFQREYDFETNPRQFTLKAIIKNYPDRSEVLDLLVDRSQNDPDEQVRKFAEEQLVIWRARTA